MERLSKRFLYYCGILVGTGMILNIDDLKHIQNLIDAEEDERLIKLPCKVGDKVYAFDYLRTDVMVVVEEVVEKVLIGEEGMEIETDGGFYYQTKWGKTVFLTKEEAEAKLKEMTGE